MPQRLAAVPLLALGALLGALVACGPPDPVEIPDSGVVDPPAPVPAVTSVSPEPGPFNAKVSVTLTTDKPAAIFVTTDGADPRQPGPGRVDGADSLSLELEKTTTLRFFSRTAEGVDEVVQSVTFIRAGGVKGTITGVVVVDTLALGHPIAVLVNGQPQELGLPLTAKEIPFTISGLGTGRHRLRAVSDQNDDGTFLPVFELSSPPQEVELDLADPYKASAEGVRLYLGAPATGLCAIQGTVTHPKPLAGETIRVSALDPGAFGGGLDPASLLGQLQNGYLVLVDAQQTEYRYVLNDLEPGSYLPVPMLTTLGNGGFSMNLQANPLAPVSCQANKVATSNLDLGPVALTGTVTLEPQTPPTGFTWGLVAAKNASFTKGLQAVLMPVIFTPDADGNPAAGFGGRGLRANALFGLRAFSSADGPAANPLLDALVWAVTPIGAAPAHATVNTGTTDTTKDFTVPLP